jgi:flagellar motility protein MotE (MotC chaperone)
MMVAIALAAAPDGGTAPSEVVPMVDAQPIAPPDGPVPPPLTRKALCGELTRTSKELSAARARLDAERNELEKLKAEIAQSRAGLRAETDKLEGLLAKRGDAPAVPSSEKANSKPSTARPQELDALARTVKSMKPEAAAALVQRTEPNLAAALLKRMKPADAGAVMDRLKPDLAADLIVLMAAIPSTPAKLGGHL